MTQDNGMTADVPQRQETAIDLLNAAMRLLKTEDGGTHECAENFAAVLVIASALKQLKRRDARRHEANEANEAEDNGR